MRSQQAQFFALAVCIFFSVTGVSFAQETYTVQQVQNRLKSQYSALEDYKVRAKLNVDMPNFRMPGKNIDLAFKRPDQVRIDAEGFAAVPRMGVTLMPEQIFDGLENLTIMENSAAGGSLVIQGTMKPDTSERPGQSPMQNGTLQMRLTIDTNRWVISGINTLQDTSVISSADIFYEEYEQKVLLPQKVVIKFHVPENMRDRGQAADMPESMGEHSPMTDFENLGTIQGQITIDFGRYRINTGLSDEFFQEQSR